MTHRPLRGNVFLDGTLVASDVQTSVVRVPADTLLYRVQVRVPGSVVWEMGLHSPDTYAATWHGNELENLVDIQQHEQCAAAIPWICIWPLPPRTARAHHPSDIEARAVGVTEQPFVVNGEVVVHRLDDRHHRKLLAVADEKRQQLHLYRWP